jgi:hypothetical protein
VEFLGRAADESVLNKVHKNSKKFPMVHIYRTYEPKALKKALWGVLQSAHQGLAGNYKGQKGPTPTS